ncbi:hypothetical protein IAE33_004550 [Pseudomonas sp. S60]|nr:hypothetical protein [Pseudomonas sp. S60]MBK5012690.1 hypothetical protein [Pseudomonas sp. S60]
MNNTLLGATICGAIILFGVFYHLGGWLRAKRGKASSDKPL